MFGGAVLDDRAVGVDHPVRSLAVRQDRAQLLDVAVAHQPPELRAVRGVGERNADVPDARQLHVETVELVVGGVTEVEDRVQSEPGEEGGVGLGGVGEVTAAVEAPVAHGAAVDGRQPADVAEVADTGQVDVRRLGTGRRDLWQLRHKGSWGVGRRRRSPTGARPRRYDMGASGNRLGRGGLGLPEGR